MRNFLISLWTISLTSLSAYYRRQYYISATGITLKDNGNVSNNTKGTRLGTISYDQPHIPRQSYTARSNPRTDLINLLTAYQSEWRFQYTFNFFRHSLEKREGIAYKTVRIFWNKTVHYYFTMLFLLKILPFAYEFFNFILVLFTGTN